MAPPPPPRGQASQLTEGFLHTGGVDTEVQSPAGHVQTFLG